VGLEEYHTVPGQGVTGFLPADGFMGDGPGQLIAQLAGIGAIAVLAFLVGWLVFLGLNLPYRARKERVRKERERTEREPKVEEANQADGDRVS
jgi:ammonia channel protein AmtB